jgi:hypothetical protein
MESTMTAATGTTRAPTGTKTESPGTASHGTIHIMAHAVCMYGALSFADRDFDENYRSSKGKGGKAK